jgi:hypothetical protein
LTIDRKILAQTGLGVRHFASLTRTSIVSDSEHLRAVRNPNSQLGPRFDLMKQRFCERTIAQNYHTFGKPRGTIDERKQSPPEQQQEPNEKETKVKDAPA